MAISRFEAIMIISNASKHEHPSDHADRVLHALCEWVLHVDTEIQQTAFDVKGLKQQTDLLLKGSDVLLSSVQEIRNILISAYPNTAEYVKHSGVAVTCSQCGQAALVTVHYCGPCHRTVNKVTGVDPRD